MKRNPLRRLVELGQSVWLDDLRREWIASGRLRRLVREDGLGGVTSNPTIFDKAIEGSRDYDDDIRSMALKGKSAAEIYAALSLRDVQDAADQLRPVYETTGGRDGFVSLEVDPRLARDTPATVAEARRLWESLGRPNVFIKVPATAEGLPAIRQLLSEGVNVNVTLLFGLPRYREVARAYLDGISARAARGHPVSGVASVASFFLSRIDVLLDPRLKGSPAKGQVAIASAKEAYQAHKEIFGGGRFKAAVARGARPQRLLWASTGTKNPEYSDVKYVDALVAHDTINTMPIETLEAYRDHGDPAVRIEEGLDQARSVLGGLSGLGIDLDRETRRLEDEGVAKFTESLEKLLKTLEGKIHAARDDRAGTHGLQPGGAARAGRPRMRRL